MLQNILNLDGAKALHKKEQQVINGGALAVQYCDTFCASTPYPSYGTRCTVHIQCPDEGACDGMGGWFYL